MHRPAAPRLAALALSLCAATGALHGQDSLVGSWEGALEGGGGPVRTVLHLALDADGRLAGTVDSPEQNVFGLALSELVREGASFAFRVPDTNGAWSGRLDEVSGALAGTWKQRGGEFDLTFERVEVDPLVGTWQGTGDFGPLKLRIVFHIGTRADGRFGASLVSPDQSPAAVPVAAVELRDDGSLHLDIPSIGAAYDGMPDAGATRIEGHLLQGGGRFALDLERVGAPALRRRPQTPEPPFPYRAEEVRYENPRGGHHLAGTLTLPPAGAPFPAVLLITGSGSQDRNEEIFGHKPFLVLADALTRAGVAVLRVDDRGVGGSTGEVAAATSADFATDVSAGVDFLRARADIRAERIGLVGHSEGGLIAPLVAVERDDVAFLVLLAGPGLRGDELLFRQAELLARAGGADDAAVALNRATQARLFEILRSDASPEQVRARLEQALVQAGGEAARARLGEVATPWMRFFVNHDPAPVLERVACPVLALNGALDLQVPAPENLAAIAAALARGGNADHTTEAYPGLNHLFQHCANGTVAEYAEIEETFAPEVLEDIAAWILARSAPR